MQLQLTGEQEASAKSSLTSFFDVPFRDRFSPAS